MAIASLSLLSGLDCASAQSAGIDEPAQLTSAQALVKVPFPQLLQQECHEHKVEVIDLDEDQDDCDLAATVIAANIPIPVVENQDLQMAALVPTSMNDNATHADASLFNGGQQITQTTEHRPTHFELDAADYGLASNFQMTATAMSAEPALVQEKNAPGCSSNMTLDTPEAKLNPEDNTNLLPAPLAINAGAPAIANLGSSLPITASRPSVTRLTSEPGSAEWGQAIGQKMIWMVNQDQQTATLTLTPPELGPLHVIVQVNNTIADATFITAQLEVKQVLETTLPQLRDMLGQAGIQLGQATVSTGSSYRQNTDQPQTPPRLWVDAARHSDAALHQRIVPYLDHGLGMVDIFV